MTGMDWMYEVSYHPHSDQGSPKTSPHTSPIPIPTLKFVARPGNEIPWDSPIESPSQQPKSHTYAPHAAHPGFESPWDSPIYDEDTYSESSYTDEPIPLRMTNATILSARKSSETLTKSLAMETSWDSPIETPDHRLHDHHAPHSHYEHEHMHTSGGSSPTSSAADPGFEVPWDSPIIACSDSAPMTPFSEIDGGDYLSEDSALHFSAKALTHPAYRNDMMPSKRGDEEEEVVVRQSKPLSKNEHPALGMTDGHFGSRQMREMREMGCALSDGASREEFLWHMYGVCGCGRKAIMTPLRRE